MSLELVEEIRHEVRRGTEDRGPGDLPLLRGESEGEAEARGVSDGVKSGDHDQESEVDSNSNTPLNPSSHRDPYGARGETGLSSDPDLILDILDDIETNLKKSMNTALALIPSSNRCFSIPVAGMV